MTEIFNKHQSVLLKETIDQLKINPTGFYLDATFGRGGHSEVILSYLGPRGRLLAMDKDPDAVNFAKNNFCSDSRFSIHHGSFATLNEFLESENLIGSLDGIFFDLGVSSPQLDQPDRGFSFLRSGKLDMRMDFSKGVDAATWIANISEKELANVLYEYGDERFSRRIAKAIVLARLDNPIVTTKQLADIVSKAHPAWKEGRHPATKSFQAIRIAVNHELDDLHIGLLQSLDALKIGGRLLVISFHSLEDRIVKNFMRNQEKGDDLPSKLPIKHVEVLPKFKKLGKAIKPTPGEINSNPRSRSAILRVGEKLL
ncbi:16S rRNA (cytosine(1402)-N(4))-methyltransferase RsmH [Gammaproteobacteria bacterium]|nr:16S rRNA (cytosine(1402)-N(4))-methyltransferase RsmH [Gammaproteobacteria bacterium]